MCTFAWVTELLSLYQKCKQEGSRTALRFISWTHLEKLGFLSHYNAENFFISVVTVISFHRKAEEERENNAFFSESYLLLMLLAQLPTDIA